jgi:hypothetical protein
MVVSCCTEFVYLTAGRSVGSAQWAFPWSLSTLPVVRSIKGRAMAIATGETKDKITMRRA